MPAGCAGGGVVATVMSNLGLERFLEGRGLTLHRTARRRPLRGRADARRRLQRRRRAVRPHDPVRLRAPPATGWSPRCRCWRCWSRTAARPARSAACSSRCRSGCAACASPAPRRCEMPRVRAAIAEAESALAGSGRLLIRESGTEPVVRVMAEGEDEALVARHRRRALRPYRHRRRQRLTAGMTAMNGPGARRRRLGFRRRRRHPGRHQDHHRARRLRDDRDHRADRAGHAGRARRPSGAAGVRARSRCARAGRHRRRRDQDRHAGRRRRHRGGVRRAGRHAAAFPSWSTR